MTHPSFLNCQPLNLIIVDCSSWANSFNSIEASASWLMDSNCCFVLLSISCVNVELFFAISVKSLTDAVTSSVPADISCVAAETPSIWFEIWSVIPLILSNSSPDSTAILVLFLLPLYQ